MNFPAPPPPKVKPWDPAKTWLIVSVVSGGLGFVVLPILFGPIALIAGFVLISQGHKDGWWGVGLGAAAVGYVLWNLIELQNALERF